MLILILAVVGWQTSVIGTPAALAEQPIDVPAAGGVFTSPTPQPTPTANHPFQPLGSIPFPPAAPDVKALREALARSNVNETGVSRPAREKPQTSDDESTLPSLSELSSDIINIVLLGADKRPEWGAWRTDTIIVVSINREAESVGMLSIPRDLWIQIPDVGVGRINTVDFIGEYQDVEGGGPALLKRTIEANLGLPVHRYARIDLEGFVQTVDALGGVTMDVECPVHDAFLDESLTGEEGFTKLELDVGVHHLDGLTALRYARSRRAGADFDRHQRQQELLRSLAEQNLNWQLIPKAPRLWETLSAAVETDLTLAEMIYLASVGMEIQQDRIKSRFIDWDTTENFVTAGGAMVLLPNDETLPQAVEEFLNPPKEDKRLELEHAQIEIFNGTTTEDLAEIAAKRLERRGLEVVDTGPISRFRRSIVIVNRTMPRTLEVLQNALRLDPDAVIESPEPDPNIDLQVVLGSDWEPCP